MAQERKSPSRFSATIVLALVGSLVIAIGCGGGGGGGTTGSSATTSTATGSTSTATGSTSAATNGASTATGSTSTATGSTSTATGSTSTSTTGILPSNVVIYGTQTLDSSNNIQTSVEYVNPDGSSKTAYESYDAHVAIAGPNPQKAGFVFAYTADTSNVLYDIYTNTTLTSTGATRLTNQGFSAVSSLQYSPDATKIIFVASIGSDVTASSLYEMNADGSGLHTVDSADDAYLASDGVHIAYTRTDSNGLGQINIVNLDGTGVHAVTSNGDDHFGVQFSKDGSHLTWAEGPFSSSGTGANGPYDIYTAAVDGSQLTKITSVAGGDNADSPTYSPDGTKVGYVLNGADTTKTGVYVVGTNGLGNTVITLDPNTIPGLFWTTSSGILSAHHAAPMIGKSIHILKLKKLGKWPGH